MLFFILFLHEMVVGLESGLGTFSVMLGLSRL